MKKQTRFTVVAAVAIFAVALVSMVVRHPNSENVGKGTVTADVLSREAAIPTASPAVIAPALETAGIQVADLGVRDIDGIVILRGKAENKEAIDRVTSVVKNLGYPRVANMIQVAKVIDDQAIERDAERQLARNRSLDGCRFNVDSTDGILTVKGVVQRELQADAARTMLSNVRGVRQVRADFRKF